MSEIGQKKASDPRVLVGCLCALGCETLYGLSYVFTKQATELCSSFALLGWRFFIALICMSLCVVTGLIRLNLKGKDLKPLLIVAFFYPGVYFIFETIGIHHTTASESGVFLACIPVASMTASALILKKKPSKIQVIGILITLFGVLATVFAVGNERGLSGLGYTCMLFAVIFYALYSVFVEKASDYSGAEITFLMMLVGAVVFISLALAEAGLKGSMQDLVFLPVKQPAVRIALLFQGIGCSVLAFFLNNIAIANIGVNRTSSFIGVSTVVSIAVGAVLLKETFSVWQVVGAVIILAGVYTANSK